MVEEVFSRIGTTDKVFVEIGVGDGMENNTAFLVVKGWSGFWLDGDKRFLAKLAERRHPKGSPIVGRVGMITSSNVVNELLEMKAPEQFDLLSLDIDHGTYHVWRALGSRFKPRVVVVEYNATLPPSQDWVAPDEVSTFWDGTHRFGASLKAFERLGAQLGYSLVGCDIIGANAFFVRSELVGDRFCSPYTSENHYEPSRFFAIHRRSHSASLLF
ncbi:hypothetical protein AYO41_04385 [Verrucomicrobia bacterium SCGC AG-212-E04]|nr:hypothetical protein AYO41_04385 [Verrucomicrobia bacterium SCGC AG-212-E04]